MGMPDTFGVVLLTFCFILALAPWFSGADFGLFKIPQFTDSAKKKLKIIGPLAFLVLVVLFMPIIPQHLPASPNSNNSNRNDSNANQSDNRQNDSNSARIKSDGNSIPPDTHAQVQQHIKRANDLYDKANLKDALEECDKALRLEPENQEASDLEAHIKRTMEILKPNH